ncbi:hypothetical protein B0H21DRAFT_750357 [Amylocystis lapponica]|nr:hypothetical protein B0H21DRAFT_750357 [Amylocystis lapponica]
MHVALDGGVGWAYGVHEEISAQTGINERTVQRLLKIVSQSGDVTTGVERKKRDPKLTDENQQFIAACLEHSPDVYLTELKAQLEEAYGVSVLPSTIWRTLRAMGFTLKKVFYMHR